MADRMTPEPVPVAIVAVIGTNDPATQRLADPEQRAHIQRAALGGTLADWLPSVRLLDQEVDGAEYRYVVTDAAEVERLRAELHTVKDGRAHAVAEAARFAKARDNTRSALGDADKLAAGLRAELAEVRAALATSEDRRRWSEARGTDAEQAARAVQAHADQMRAELEAGRAERADVADRVERVHAVLAGATWRYAMVHARDVRAALTGAAEGPPLVDVITAAIVMHLYPPDEWPDGPPGEGEHDRAREEAEAIVRAITGAPEPASEVTP